MIFAEKRPHTPIEDEVIENKEKITFGEFLDKCPTHMLIEVWNAIQNELTTRFKNERNFVNQFLEEK